MKRIKKKSVLSALGWGAFWAAMALPVWAAQWKVEVHDLRTHEVKIYKPPAGEIFGFEVPGGFKCITYPAEDGQMLSCTYVKSEHWFSTMAICGYQDEAGLLFGHGQTPKSHISNAAVSLRCE